MIVKTMTLNTGTRLDCLWLVALTIVGCGDKNKMNVESAFGPGIPILP